MLKSVIFNRCFLCTIAQSQALPRFISSQISSLFDLDNIVDHKQIKEKFTPKDGPWNIKLSESKKRPSNKNIQAIKDILDKYNIESSELNIHSNIIYLTPWMVEKQIMLLEEIGVSQVTFSLVENFSTGFYLNVALFKAHAKMDSHINVAQNMLSHIKSVNIDYSMLNIVDDKKVTIKQQFIHCLVTYLKLELELTEEEANFMSGRKSVADVYNSFRLLERMLKYCRNVLGMDNSQIKRNWWLYSQHPGQGQAVQKILAEHYGDISIEYMKKKPRIVTAQPDNVQQIIQYLQNYEITPEMIKVAPRIFTFTPWELKKRLEHLTENPFTHFYKKHPRFLLLVNQYYTLLPRISYLREKNLSYATIHGLVTFHNPIESLTAKKKLNTLNTQSFFETNFGEDADELIKSFKKHPFWSYSSPVKMFETLSYLKEKFTQIAINKHIYAILYDKKDVETAYKWAMEDSKYSKLCPNKLLALCIYKIEEMFHFTGEGVLSPEKFTEIHQESNNEKDEQNVEQLVQESDDLHSYDTQSEDDLKNK